MRKGLAILLLCCFALYHFGYYVAYFSFRFQIESRWMEKIYSESQEGFEEQLLKIPLSLPYAADQEEFQLTNTYFEKDGQHYRVIKQRYVGDTLQMIYVPDLAKRDLDKTIKKWISSLVQDEVPHQNDNLLLDKLLIKDYTQPQNDLDFRILLKDEREHRGFVFSGYDSQTIPLNTPPPEFV